MQDVFAQGVSVSKRFYWKVVPLMMEFVHVCALKGIEARDKEGLLFNTMVLDYLSPQITIPHK